MKNRDLQMEIKCPYCNNKQNQKPVKSWIYTKMIEKRSKSGTKWNASTKCYRYSCNCGKSFTYYLTAKKKYWTIPKSKKEKL